VKGGLAVIRQLFGTAGKIMLLFIMCSDEETKQSKPGFVS